MEEKQKLTLEILVAEDRKKNLAAARQYFDGLGSKVRVTYVTTYEDAVREMSSGRYSGAIVDNNMPEKLGEVPKPFGAKLYKLGNFENMTPTFIFTTESHAEAHGNEERTMLTNGDYENVERLPPRFGYTGPKYTPEAWKYAFETLLKEEIVETIQELKNEHGIEKVREFCAKNTQR